MARANRMDAPSFNTRLGMYDAVLYFDGAAPGNGKNPGNPGRGAYGFVIERRGLADVEGNGRLDRATNNQSEYAGLIHGLKRASALGIKTVLVRGDSELVINQMRGTYRVRAARLRPLHDNARALARHFAAVTFEHVVRGQNIKADRLANEALDTAGCAMKR